MPAVDSLLHVCLIAAPQDKHWAERLETHLRALTYTGRLVLEGSHRVAPGALHDEALGQMIRRAHLVLLMVGPDLLGSLLSEPLQTQLHQARIAGKVVTWVRAAPCFTTHIPSIDGVSPLGALRALGQPLSGLAYPEPVRAKIRYGNQR